ncbi:dynein axonemal assembly factor 3 homolog [Drosophila tropicalis]|uniref:dynein axonemal assembly factor 3 homolog n=1 Tax=Drosophila tropicalis TaxID=46794 RepID=UPI0035ABA8E3
MFWGISTALDLYEEYAKAFKLQDDCEVAGAGDTSKVSPAALNILICGGADARHVIKTLAKRYTHRVQPKLNIYVLDGCEEILARSMLLLAIALESSDSFSLVGLVHLFMDVYGNSMMRPTTHHYVAAKARTLLKMVTDEEQLQHIAPMLNLDGLKYREKDGMEMAFNFWQPKPIHFYDIKSYWEQRSRALLGGRYDHRLGVWDWDLSMTLKDREGQQICSQEYRYWRESGIAFVFPEYELCKPNKTFAAGLVRNGRTYLHRGYVGDIQTGPFCGFGLRTSEERMLNSVHGENDYRSTDIVERNLLELFHELQTQTPYKHDPTRSRRYGSVLLQMSPVLTYNEADDHNQEIYDKPWIEMPNITVHFISPMDIVQLKEGAKRWRGVFDIAFVAHNYINFLTKEFFNVLKDQALMIQETKLMTVERKEHLNNFESKAKDLMKEAGLRPSINYQAINGKNMFLKYKKCVGAEEELEEEVVIDEKKVVIDEKEVVVNEDPPAAESLEIVELPAN